MKETYSVKIYPTMSWHWKQQGLQLGLYAAVILALNFLLPSSITSSRIFIIILMAPVIIVVYSKYMNKATTFKEEPITLNGDGTLTFLQQKYSRNDISFYKYKVQGANYGSVITLDKDGSRINILANGSAIEDDEKYQGNFNYLKHPNHAVEKEVFDAITAFAFKS